MSLALNNDDKELFRQAMVLDGYPDSERGLTTWMKQVCRIRARALISGKTDESLLEAINHVQQTVDAVYEVVRKDTAYIETLERLLSEQTPFPKQDSSHRPRH